MLNCKETTKLVSLGCEQKLSFKQKLQLKIHLMMCAKCRGFAQNTKSIDLMMKKFCRDEADLKAK